MARASRPCWHGAKPRSPSQLHLSQISRWLSRRAVQEGNPIGLQLIVEFLDVVERSFCHYGKQPRIDGKHFIAKRFQRPLHPFELFERLAKFSFILDHAATSASLCADFPFREPVRKSPDIREGCSILSRRPAHQSHKFAALLGPTEYYIQTAGTRRLIEDLTLK